MSHKLRFYRAIVIIISLALFQLFIFTRLQTLNFLSVIFALIFALMTTALLLFVLMQSIKIIPVFSNQMDKSIVIILGVIINAVVLYMMFVLIYNYLQALLALF